MRKKLLALLMCATMVLGTSVTAFADSTQDTVDKITGKNANKFAGNNTEVAANGVNGTVKDSVTYTYKDGDNTLVNTVDVCYDTTNAADTGIYTPVVMFTADDGSAQPATKVDKIVTVNDADYPNTSAKSIALAKYGASTDIQAIKIKFAAGGDVTYLVKSTGVVGKTSVISGTNYVKTKNDAVKQLKANSKILADTAITLGKVWANVAVAPAKDINDMQQGLYEGVKAGKISENAFAVSFTTYVQEDNGIKTEVVPGITDADGNAVKAAKIYDNFKNFLGGTFSLDYDLFTNSTLKSAPAIKVYKFTGYTSEYSDLFKKPIAGFIELGTSEIGGKVTFENLNSLSGTFLFDAGVAADKNDGVADEETKAPAADNTASPKTGDVAPIAALAVVMMGAFGAMVVASKKRA